MPCKNKNQTYQCVKLIKKIAFFSILNMYMILNKK